MSVKIPTRTHSYNVLLVGEDPKQTELYSDLIREVADCHVDVISRVESSFDWVGRSNYNLIVVDTSQLGQPGQPSGQAGQGAQQPGATGSQGHPMDSGGESAQRAVTRVDGLAVLEKVKRISPVTSVILISDQANVEEAVASIRLGAEDYLKKPFNLESFQLAVKRGLDRKTVFGENSGASSYLNLLNACQMISASLEQNKIFSTIESYITRELHSDHSAIYSYANGELTRQSYNAPEQRKDRAMEEILDIALHAGSPMPRMIEGGEMYRFMERGQLTPGLFLFKFRCVGEVDYFCVCLSPERPLSIETFESRLRMLKAQIEVTGKNIEEYMGVQHLVYVDDATGLYNTRYLNYILDREIAESMATQRSFAILFIDADKFKGVNDGHGHLVGTKLLHELGLILKKLVRGSDTVFRYGGDEFVAVLTSCDLKTAQAVAERIRQSVEKRSFLAKDGLNIHFTVSIGVALFPEHASSKKDVIAAADGAMYTAKKKSRNCVFIADLKQIAAEKANAVETPAMTTASPGAPSVTAPVAPAGEAPVPAAKPPLRAVRKDGQGG